MRFFSGADSEPIPLDALPSDFSEKGKFLSHRRVDVEGVGFNSRSPQRLEYKSDTPPPGSFNVDVPPPHYKQVEGFHRSSERVMSHQEELMKRVYSRMCACVCVSVCVCAGVVSEWWREKSFTPSPHRLSIPPATTIPFFNLFLCDRVAPTGSLTEPLKYHVPDFVEETLKNRNHHIPVEGEGFGVVSPQRPDVVSGLSSSEACDVLNV